MRGFRSACTLDDHYEDADARDIAAHLAPDAARTFYPGEPISPCVRRRRGSSMGSAFLVILAMSGIGWALLQTEAYWRPWAEAHYEALMVEVARARAMPEVATKTETPAPSELQPQTAEQPVARTLAEAPGSATGEPVAAPAAAEQAPAVQTSEAADDPSQSSPADAQTPPDAAPSVTTEAVEPLPAPEVDPADPYQKRALSVGLHPQLSRVLLRRMTDADYANAKVAIEKAIAQLGDGAEFVWPRTRTSKHALFRVHFVKGAAAACRRYVVTVTKDGWTTTAMPMERCGTTKTTRAAT